MEENNEWSFILDSVKKEKNFELLISPEFNLLRKQPRYCLDENKFAYACSCEKSDWDLDDDMVGFLAFSDFGKTVLLELSGELSFDYDQRILKNSGDIDFLVELGKKGYKFSVFSLEYDEVCALEEFLVVDSKYNLFAQIKEAYADLLKCKRQPKKELKDYFPFFNHYMQKKALDELKKQKLNCKAFEKDGN